MAKLLSMACVVSFTCVIATQYYIPAIRVVVKTVHWQYIDSLPSVCVHFAWCWFSRAHVSRVRRDRLVSLESKVETEFQEPTWVTLPCSLQYSSFIQCCCIFWLFSSTAVVIADIPSNSRCVLAVCGLVVEAVSALVSSTFWLTVGRF